MKIRIVSGVKMWLSNSVSLKSVLFMLFTPNLIFLSFTFSSQVRLMFFFDTFDSGNMVFTMIGGFIALTFTVFIALHADIFATKRPIKTMNSGIWDS
jgi:hypothetical protein